MIKVRMKGDMDIMRKIHLRGLVIIAFLCGVIYSDITVKAEEMEIEEASEEPINTGAILRWGSYSYRELDDGTVEITKYSDSDATEKVNIPSKIEGKKVTSIGNQAFMNRNKPVEIIIPNGVINIGDYAFFGITTLTKVTIPSSVTTIGDFAFFYDSNLADVIIPSSVTSVGEGAFAYSGITDIILPTNATSIGRQAFKSCKNLTKVTIPSNIISIGESAFAFCTNLTEIIISDNVTTIGEWAFAGCTSLTEVNIPDSVISIGTDAFHSCTNLIKLTVPSSVTSIGSQALYNCPVVVIYCNAGSYAEEYAKSKYILYDNFYLCKATLSKTTYTYDGKEKKPAVTVKDGTKTLKNGTDYTVNYPTNNSMGKATVTITGKGNYIGTIKKTITISKADYYNINTHGGEWKNNTYYYLGGVMMTNIFFSDGKYTYYLQADGTPMKNRLTYHPDGIHLIYFDDKGHELFDKFQYCADVGYTCYFDTFGYLYKDVITFSNGKPYYLDGTGRMKQNECFKFDNGVDIGYAQADGSLINTGFGYDSWGRVVFYHWNGMIGRGLITDGTWYYDMDVTDGHLIGQFAAN